jgi:ferredoxin
MGALRSPRTPQPLRCPLSPHPQPSALSSLCGAPMFCGYHVAECPHAALRLYFQPDASEDSCRCRCGGFSHIQRPRRQPYGAPPPGKATNYSLPVTAAPSLCGPCQDFCRHPAVCPAALLSPPPFSSPPFHTLRRLSSRLSFCPVLRRVNRRRHSLYSRAGTRTPVSRRSLSDQCPALEGRSSSPPPHPLPRRTVMGSPFETG